MRTRRMTDRIGSWVAAVIMWLLATLYCVATSPVDGWHMMRDEAGGPGGTPIGGTAGLVIAACGGGIVTMIITILAGMR